MLNKAMKNYFWAFTLVALAACAPAPTTQELGNPYNSPKPVFSKPKPIPPVVVDFGPATIMPSGPVAEGDCSRTVITDDDGTGDAWTTCYYD